MPKLSVIVCAYNAENHIKESLESALNQSFSDFELILVDDGSTDKTSQILLKYAERANITLLVNKYNEGVPFSRNKALLTATGEYIAIHDADDVSLFHRFEEQVKVLDSNSRITFIGSLAYRISSVGQIIGHMTYPKLAKDTEGAFFAIQRFKLNPVIDPSSMFRRQAVLDIGGYRMDPELRTVQDFDLWCRLLIKGHQMLNIQKPLIKYRINPKGVTRLRKQEQEKATDLVWSAFKKRSFPIVSLCRERYQQDSDFDILNINKEN